MSEWWKPSPAGEVPAIPWLAPKVIARLEEIVKPTFHVIEHGCGGSTLWFAERAASVIAFDDNAKWREKINAKLDPARARVFSELGNRFATAIAEKFDLLLIDGEPLEDRIQWIRFAPDIVKPGGWVVLDNANREILTGVRAWLHEQSESVETFNGNEGGTLYLVTEFYKMKASEDENRIEPKPAKSVRRTGKRGTGGATPPA